MFTRFSPVYHDAADDGGSGAAPADDIEIPEGVDPAELIDPEPAEFEVPEELPEGDTFDRAYVEGLRQEAAARRVAARDLEERFKDLDPDRARQGVHILDRLQTQEGVVEAAYATLEALGMKPGDIETTLQTLVKGEAPAGDDDDPDLDIPMTKREIQAYLAEQQKLAGQSEEERQQTALVATLRNKIVETFTELQVDDEDDRQVLLTVAEQIAQRAGIDTSDPALVPDVLKAAKTEVDRRAAEAARALIAAKLAQRDTTPKTMAGGGGTDDGEVTPGPDTRSLAEVIADRKKKK